MSRLSEVVHINVSIAKFKQLIRTMKEVRYVIDSYGRIHVGHAENFIHSSIKHEAFENYEKDSQGLLIHGYATIDEDEKTLLHYISYISHRKAGKHLGDYASERDEMFRLAHPKIEELASRGVQHCKSPFHFVC